MVSIADERATGATDEAASSAASPSATATWDEAASFAAAGAVAASSGADPVADEPAAALSLDAPDPDAEARAAVGAASDADAPAEEHTAAPSSDGTGSAAEARAAAPTLDEVRPLEVSRAAASAVGMANAAGVAGPAAPEAPLDSAAADSGAPVPAPDATGSAEPGPAVAARAALATGTPAADSAATRVADSAAAAGSAGDARRRGDDQAAPQSEPATDAASLAPATEPEQQIADGAPVGDPAPATDAPPTAPAATDAFTETADPALDRPGLGPPSRTVADDGPAAPIVDPARRSETPGQVRRTAPDRAPTPPEARDTPPPDADAWVEPSSDAATARSPSVDLPVARVRTGGSAADSAPSPVEQPLAPAKAGVRVGGAAARRRPGTPLSALTVDQPPPAEGPTTRIAIPDGSAPDGLGFAEEDTHRLDAFPGLEAAGGLELQPPEAAPPVVALPHEAAPAASDRPAPLDGDTLSDGLAIEVASAPAPFDPALVAPRPAADTDPSNLPAAGGSRSAESDGLSPFATIQDMPSDWGQVVPSEGAGQAQRFAATDVAEVPQPAADSALIGVLGPAPGAVDVREVSASEVILAPGDLALGGAVPEHVIEDEVLEAAPPDTGDLGLEEARHSDVARAPLAETIVDTGAHDPTAGFVDMQPPSVQIDPAADLFDPPPDEHALPGSVHAPSPRPTTGSVEVSAPAGGIRPATLATHAPVGADLTADESPTHHDARIPSMRRVRAPSVHRSPAQDSAEAPPAVTVTGVGLDDPQDTVMNRAPAPSYRPTPNEGPRRPAVEREPTGRAPASGDPVARVSAPAAPSRAPAPTSSTPDGVSDRVVGVDLGGRVARVSALEAGVLRFLELDGAPAFGVVIAVLPDGRIVVGNEALEIEARDPARTASVIELLRAVDERMLASDTARRAVARDQHGKHVATIAEHTIELETLLHALFEPFAAALNHQIGEGRTRVIVSVPHELSDRARTMLTDGLKRAGLVVASLVPEPTAILRPYQLAVQGQETVLTVDLGGTHLGVALARRGRDGFFVAESSWHVDMNSHALDRAIAELVLAEAGRAPNSLDPASHVRLMQSVRIARQDLRREATITVEVPAPERGAGGPPFDVVQLPRSRVYQATQSVTDQVVVAARNVLTTAGLHPKTIGALIVAGSGGSFPPVVGALTTMTGREPLHTVPPGDVLALGLAEACADSSSGGRSHRLEALSASVGIGLPGGRFKVLVPAGTKLPTSVSRKNPTTRDDQTTLELTFYQGSGDTVGGSVHLGGITLSDLPKAARGRIVIDVDLYIDREAVMTVTMAEPMSGKKKRLTVATQQTTTDRRSALAKRQSIEDLSGPGRAAGKKGFFGRLFGR